MTGVYKMQVGAGAKNVGGGSASSASGAGRRSPSWPCWS